jgi:hypothetical protein
MEEFLIVLLQLVAELVFDVLAYWPFDWSFSRRSAKPDGIAAACGLLFLTGGVLAAFSLLIVSHTIISIGAFRILNLILAPIGSGLIFSSVARRRRRATEGIVPRDHFWMAFCFTLGWVAVRFAFATR